jgi:hypothetical protein
LVYGWSLISHKGNYAYLKHLSVFDQVDIEDVRQQYYDKAKSRGLPTEAESLERLRQEGMWTEEDEGKIAEQLNFIHGAQKTKKQYYLKAEIEKANKDIKVAQVRMLELQVQKDSLLGQTCEKYAISRLWQRITRFILFLMMKIFKKLYCRISISLICHFVKMLTTCFRNPFLSFLLIRLNWLSTAGCLKMFLRIILIYQIELKPTPLKL